MKKNDVDVEEGDDEDTFIGNYFLVFVESYFSINQLKKTHKKNNSSPFRISRILLWLVQVWLFGVPAFVQLL